MKFEIHINQNEICIDFKKIVKFNLVVEKGVRISKKNIVF